MKIKKITLFVFASLVLSSCEPLSVMDASVKNNASRSISVVFASSEVSLNKTLEIAPNETMLFQEGLSVGGGFLEPSLLGYNSIYVRNELNEVLKIYKENSNVKNIYTLNDWIFNEPSKRVYKYNYPTL